MGNEVVRHIRSELKKIYSNSDGVADGIAIEHGNDVYIVDSGRENGSITFGIRRKKRIPDAKFRTDFIRENNNDAVSKGYVSDALSQRLGNGMGSDSGRSLRGKSGTEFQIDSRESGDNQRGVSGEDADIGRLKDASRTFADSLTEPTKYQTRDGSGTKDQPDFTAIENKKEITVLCPLQWIPQSRLTINMPEIKENLPQVNPQLHNSLGIINDKSSMNIVSDSGAKVNTFLIICSNFMWKKLSLPKAEILFQEHMNSKYTKNSRTT
mgnify:FL=1